MKLNPKASDGVHIESENVDAPIPSPDNDDYSRCRQCGAKYRVGVEYCPLCGAKVRSVATGVGSVLSQILFGIGILLFGSLGGCSMIGLTLTVASRDWTNSALIGCVTLAFFGLAIRCVKEMIKRRP